MEEGIVLRFLLDDFTQSSSEPGEDSDEEDHADESERDEDEHQPQEPVDRLFGVLLQSLRLRLQLLEVQIGLTHGVAQGLRGEETRRGEEEMNVSFNTNTELAIPCLYMLLVLYCPLVDK